MRGRRVFGGSLNEEENTREARINRAGDQTIGVAIFLTATELRELGIDPVGAETVTYSVVDGEIQLAPPNWEATNE